MERQKTKQRLNWRKRSFKGPVCDGMSLTENRRRKCAFVNICEAFWLVGGTNKYRLWRRRTLARSKLACFNVQTCTENGKSWPHGLETFVSSLNGPILIKYIYNMFTCFFSKLHPRYSVYCFCQADFWPGLKHVMHRLDEAWNVSVFVAASLT